MTRLCVIPGDGIGLEVTRLAAEVLLATGAIKEIVEAEAGWDCFQRTGTALPEATIAAVRASDATLFGAVQSPTRFVEGYRSPILALRQSLDLYANVRPTRSLPLANSRAGIDLVIVRENTEGLYSGIERMDGDSAVAERVITRTASERIGHFAFELASLRAAQLGRPGRVTIVHKANVLPLTDGLFRDSVRSVATGFPEIEVQELLVDAMAYRLVRDPESFDVIVTTNLFGDILSDEASALVGGLGVAASGNIGSTGGIYEPVHGSAPDIAGSGIANPVGSLLSAVMLLEDRGHFTEATALHRAVVDTLSAGIRTPDLGGESTTRQFTEEVIRRL